MPNQYWWQERFRFEKLIRYSEVDRAIDNLVKSGKMFNLPGRRESLPLSGPPRDFSQQFGMSRSPLHLHPLH